MTELSYEGKKIELVLGRDEGNLRCSWITLYVDDEYVDEEEVDLRVPENEDENIREVERTLLERNGYDPDEVFLSQ